MSLHMSSFCFCSLFYPKSRPFNMEQKTGLSQGGFCRSMWAIFPIFLLKFGRTTVNHCGALKRIIIHKIRVFCAVVQPLESF